MPSNKRLLKLMVVLYSLVNIVVGFTLVLLSLAIVSTGFVYFQPREKTTLLYVLSFGITLCGLLTLIGGILGLLGAVCRSPCLLAVTGSLLLLPFAASIYIWNTETASLRVSIRDQIDEIFLENYGENDHITMVVDFVQSTLRCCGVNGPADWAESVYNTGVNMSSKAADISLLSAAAGGNDKDYLIPPSCCRSKKRCTIARNITIAKNFTPRRGIYARGCASVVDSHMNAVLEQAETILLTDALIDVVGIICTWLLFVVVQRELAKESGAVVGGGSGGGSERLGTNV